MNAEALALYEDADLFVPQPEENVVPVVMSPTEASRFVSAIRRIREKRDEIKAIRDAEVARIDDWYKGQLRILDNNTKWYEQAVLTYLINMRRNIPNYILHTPFGTVSLKKPGEEWKYPENENSFISFLEEHNLPFIRVKKEIDRKSIRERCRSVPFNREDGLQVLCVCTDDGMVLDGITVEPTPETLVCRFTKVDDM